MNGQINKGKCFTATKWYELAKCKGQWGNATKFERGTAKQ